MKDASAPPSPWSLEYLKAFTGINIDNVAVSIIITEKNTKYRFMEMTDFAILFLLYNTIDVIPNGIISNILKIPRFNPVQRPGSRWDAVRPSL